MYIGLAGNIAGMFWYRKPGFILIGPKNIYFYFFLMDTIYLLISVKLFLQYGFETNLESNMFWCKIYTYISYSVSSIPIWLTVYITFERYVSLQYPSKGKTLRNQRNQRIGFIFIVISNFVFYMPVLFSNVKDIRIDNHFNNFLIQCNFVYYNDLLLALLLINRMILPFSFNTFGSILLIRIIYKLKDKYFVHYSFEECAKFKKEVKASLVSISINLLLILLNLPLFVVHFFFSHLISLYLFTFYLFVLNYAVKFYLIIVAVKLFQKDKCANFVLRKKSRYVSLIQNDVIKQDYYCAFGSPETF